MTTTQPHATEPDVEGFVLPSPATAAPRPAELAESLVEQARTEGVELVGPGGLLGDLTKKVLEAGLEAELDEHLGYAKHDPAGRDGGNSRNGTRTKTVITEVGPVDIDVPRDRDGSFEPKLVRKRQRRLGGEPPRVRCSLDFVAFGSRRRRLLSWHVRRSTRRSCVVERSLR